MVAILGYSREQIRMAVREMYTAVAEQPLSGFHFPVGRDACATLGYPRDDIQALPDRVAESFAGVGYPFRAEVIRPGDTVLDIGAGAGVDSLIAARRTGSEGHVIGLDLTPAMARKLGADADDNVSAVQASAERLPFADGSIDVITSNGALNLVPDKRAAIAEMFRVLRADGRLQIADVVIRRPVTVDCHDDPRLWVECVVGATVDDELLAMFRDAGFADVRVLRELDYFAHSPSRQTREVAAGFGARSLEATMARGAQAPPRWLQWLRRADPRRLARAVWRRGFAGMAGLFLALLACYGTLLAVAMLSFVGAGLGVDETAWTGAIMLFTLLAAAGIGAGGRRHGRAGPAGLAAAGALLVGYALLVDYHIATELAGFLTLAAAAASDLYLNRREQQRVLGLRRTDPRPAD